MSMPIKYMDRGWVMKANKYAQNKKWKNTIPSEMLWRLPENKIIPICFMVPEDDTKITITLTLDANIEKGKAVNYKLDIPWLLWKKLPEVESPEEESESDSSDPVDGMGFGAKKFLGME